MGSSHGKWVQDELLRLEKQQLRRELRMRESPHVAGWIQIQGRQYIDLSSNDYLGLSADQRLVEAVRQAAGQVGWGAAASPLVTGRSVLHARLERGLAELKRSEGALLFPTGFAANLGAVTALTSPGDMIFSDARNHASIIDGCRLSRADVAIYRHADVEHLQQLLESAGACRKVIVTDSVFSMDGDVAPLKQLVALAAEYDCLVIVDEAHATGVLGERGAGACEAAGVESGVLVRVGTLSKALGSLGGFVAAPTNYLELIWHRARSFMFSTAQPEAVSAAAVTALEIARDEPWRRTRVCELTRRLAAALGAQGWNLGPAEAAILPVYLGNPQTAIELSGALRDQGIWAPAIRPPAVPVGNSLIRLSLTASHTDSQIESVVDAFEKSRN